MAANNNLSVSKSAAKTRFKTHRRHKKTLMASLRAESMELKEQLLLAQYQINYAKQECQKTKLELDKLINIKDAISPTEQNKMLTTLTWHLGYLESILVLKDTKMSALSFKESLEDKNWHFDQKLSPKGPSSSPFMVDITDKGLTKFTIDCKNSTLEQTPQAITGEAVGDSFEIATQTLQMPLAEAQGSGMSETDIMFNQLVHCVEFNTLMDQLEESENTNVDSDFQNDSLMDLISIPPNILWPGPKL